MSKYLLKRLGLMILSLLIVVIIVFFLLKINEQTPKAVENSINSNLKNPGSTSPNDAIANAYKTAGYVPNQNIFTSFWEYIKGIFTRGDFGEYFDGAGHEDNEISSLVFRYFKYSIIVVGPAFVLGTILGVTFGFISGYNRGKWSDITINVFAILFVSIPSFVLAILLALFAKDIGLPIKYPDASSNPSVSEVILAIIIPIVVITLGSFATLTYYIRNEVVEVLASDFIIIARSKGVSEKRILLRHVARNVSIPAVSIILPSFVALLSGSMIIEIFFGVPGTSQIFASAVTNHEYYVILFSVIFFTTISLLTSLLADVLFVLLDPRIKIADKSNDSIVKRFKASKRRKKESKIIRGEANE